MGTPTETRHRIDTRTLAARGALAIVLSAAANAVLLTVVLETALVAPFMALSYPPVIFLSVAGAVGATAVYGLLARRVGDPDRAFLRVAVGVLVLSFVPDIGVLFLDEAATPGAVAVLAAMHVLVAAACAVSLTRLRR